MEQQSKKQKQQWAVKFVRPNGEHAERIIHCTNEHHKKVLVAMYFRGLEVLSTERVK